MLLLISIVHQALFFAVYWILSWHFGESFAIAGVAAWAYGNLMGAMWKKRK
jgi:hypothetical protein